MIDEERLVALLQHAADEIVIPPEGAAQVLVMRNVEERRRESPRPKRPRRRLFTVVTALACVVVVFAAVFAFGRSDSSLHNVVRAGPAVRFSNGLGVTSPTKAAAPTVPGVDTLERIVKTGSIDLEVSKGGFATVTDRLSSLATGAGGFVSASSTVESADVPTGSVTLRVPAAAFDDVLAQVRSLGRVLQVTSKGEDVTAQYVDLDARISALTATRHQYETLLTKATSIADTLNVQQRISDLQTQIEQLQGQQRVLQDHSSLATLDVHLSPPGAGKVKLTAAKPPTGMAKAWHRAKSGFGAGIEAVVAASGTVAFLLLLGAVLLVIVRLAWPLFRRRLI